MLKHSDRAEEWDSPDALNSMMLPVNGKFSIVLWYEHELPLHHEETSGTPRHYSAGRPLCFMNEGNNVSQCIKIYSYNKY